VQYTAAMLVIFLTGKDTGKGVLIAHR
jgi:hypothetical protein